MFEFVGQVAATKFWSLRLDFQVKMVSSHEGSWSPGLVAGTSPSVCADLKTFDGTVTHYVNQNKKVTKCKET